MYRLLISPGVLLIVLSFIQWVDQCSKFQENLYLQLNSVVVTADTSSPASDMITGGFDLKEFYRVVKEYECNGYGFQMCPTPLFAEIVKINHTRNRISKSNCTDEDDLHKMHSKSCVMSTISHQLHGSSQMNTSPKKAKS
jgi:hypothetical protein